MRSLDTGTNENRRIVFTRQMLKALIIPLMLEQLLTITVGLADSLMVSRVGQASISAVNLVDQLSNLMIQIFAGMAAGGAAVAGQYLGKKMTLMVIEGKKSRYDVIDDKIIVTTRKNEIGEIKKTIKNLYFDTIKSKMDVLVPLWCNELGLKIPEYGVNRAKGKWGVCYPVEGRLYLSYMCATLSDNLIDMTVLHEVCHLVYSGHGKRFWGLMKTHMPDLEQRKAELAKVAKSGWSMNIV